MDKKQIGQVIVLGSALVLNLSASSYAVAASACSNGTGVTIASAATNFVKNDFVTKCSANVTADYSQDQTDFAVKAASIKGMHTFGGSTIGGAVAACESTSVASPVANLGTANLTSVSGKPAGC